jgi:hypothetical protein
MSRIIEIFKPIVIDGEQTNYLISDDGCIINTITNHIVHSRLNTAGYPIVNLSIDGKIVTKRVHILLANAFIPNIENKPIINHINGVKTDNRLENLEWCTYSENTKHAFRTGLNHGPRGILNSKCIYTEKQIQQACTLLEQGALSIKQISKITHIKPLTIRHLLRKVRWKHIVSDYDFSGYDKRYSKK